MTHHDDHHSDLKRSMRFSLAQHGVGARLALAAVLVVLIWVTVLALVR
jgi:hypothetical protein